MRSKYSLDSSVESSVALNISHKVREVLDIAKCLDSTRYLESSTAEVFKEL